MDTLSSGSIYKIASKLERGDLVNYLETLIGTRIVEKEVLTKS